MSDLAATIELLTKQQQDTSKQMEMLSKLLAAQQEQQQHSLNSNSWDFFVPREPKKVLDADIIHLAEFQDDLVYADGNKNYGAYPHDYLPPGRKTLCSIMTSIRRADCPPFSEESCSNGSLTQSLELYLTQYYYLMDILTAEETEPVQAYLETEQHLEWRMRIFIDRRAAAWKFLVFLLDVNVTNKTIPTFWRTFPKGLNEDPVALYDKIIKRTAVDTCVESIERVVALSSLKVLPNESEETFLARFQTAHQRMLDSYPECSYSQYMLNILYISKYLGLEKHKESISIISRIPKEKLGKYSLNDLVVLFQQGARTVSQAERMKNISSSGNSTMLYRQALLTALRDNFEVSNDNESANQHEELNYDGDQLESVPGDGYDDSPQENHDDESFISALASVVKQFGVKRKFSSSSSKQQASGKNQLGSIQPPICFKCGHTGHKSPVCSTPVDQYKAGYPKASNLNNVRLKNGGVGLLAAATEMVYTGLVDSNSESV